MRACGLVVMALSVLASACGGKGSANDGEPTDCSGLPELLCGEPGVEPPHAQGAMSVALKAASPSPAGKSCPVAASSTEIPSGGGLDRDTYLQNVVDGEEMASVECSVVGASTFEILGHVLQAGRGLKVAASIGQDRTGVGRITVLDAGNLSQQLVGEGCTISAAIGVGSQLQVKAGAVWASFTCPSVEGPPSDSCAATGVFVLENCEQ